MLDARRPLHRLGVGLPLRPPFGHRPAHRQVAVDRVMRAGLVGDDVGPHAAADQFGKHVRRVADEADRLRLAGRGPAVDHRQRLVEVGRLGVEVAGADAEIDPGLVAFHREAAGAGEHRRQRLRPAHAAEAAGQDPAALEVAAVVLAAGLGEGLVGALHDALRADVDPRAGGHLAVHHQPGAIEFVELVPGRPVRHQVRVGDQHPRRVGVGAEHADRLARLHQQRLVGLERLEARDDAVEIGPGARRPPDPAVDDELVRVLGDVGMQVVHQHPHRRLGQPRLGGDLRPGGRIDVAQVVPRVGHVVSPPKIRAASGFQPMR